MSTTTTTSMKGSIMAIVLVTGIRDGKLAYTNKYEFDDLDGANNFVDNVVLGGAASCDDVVGCVKIGDCKVKRVF